VTWEVREGDALARLRNLPDASVQCCVTSPPYFGLRDYGHTDQIGLEQAPEEYVARLVEVFREVRRVLRSDGTLWLNVGDSYWGSGPNRQTGLKTEGRASDYGDGSDTRIARHGTLKPKDLVGIPWAVAFAMRSDGWYLRSDVIWAKRACMPESVTDRPTRAHEYVFLLTKSADYFFDQDAVREPHQTDGAERNTGVIVQSELERPKHGNKM